ncbi:hypothetical protein BGZ65_004690 [Modicella reniformis]|uniref:Phorbol-ester/DAG-type domain-containing protein n=1 Tax=Modicella reniformis TaxID=1440133 RepID=A0A9P6J635_9FUNG|nr:hypothetical protein BGZ65_004690 [Modicella reniformis]
MANDEPLQTTIRNSSSIPLSQQSSPYSRSSRSSRNLSHPSLPHMLLQSSPALTALDYLSQIQRATDPLQLPLPPLPPVEFPPGEDIHGSKNVSLPSRIGSTGSQLVSPANEMRKRRRRVLQRPRPLDLNQTKLNKRSSQQATATTMASDTRPSSAFPVLESGPALGLDWGSRSVSRSGTGSGTTPQDSSAPKASKEPKSKQRFPLLQIKTDLTASGPFRRTSTGGISISSSQRQRRYRHQSQDQQNLGQPVMSAISAQEVQRKELSEWQAGLERRLKKIQRRRKAPSNLAWYAAHSTESYLAGETLDLRPGTLKNGVDLETQGLCFGQDKPLQWVVDSSQGGDLFFSDDTVELMLNLRDYLIKATEDGWDVAELKEEIFPVMKRSVSPHGSPCKITSAPPTSGPVSPGDPGDISHDSAPSSRRGSRSSFEFDFASHITTGRQVDEESGSYRLLDYFTAILSDVISHDCRYKVQHPRPSRPEWILHSIVLDILQYISKILAHDHKAIYNLGMVALPAFLVFKQNALIRLMDLLTDTILPSFAHSRAQSFGSLTLPTPTFSLKPGSPLSPSEIRVQLDNNQTFAIQVHSPTEEQGMLAVPRESGQPFKSLGSPRVPSPRTSSVSLSRASRGPISHAQDAVDPHAKSLIALTLLTMLQQIPFSKSPLPVANQFRKSIGDLLRIKPDLSADVLEMIAIVGNEVLMHRALEVLWWIGWPSLGHHVLGEKLCPLEYESVLLMQQAQQEWNPSSGGSMGPRRSTMKSENRPSSRRATLEGNTIHRGDVAMRSGIIGNLGIRSKLSHRNTISSKPSQGIESIPMTLTQQTAAAMVAAGTDYLTEHELYPYMFSLSGDSDQDTAVTICCERCELIMKGFGLYCYHCRGALHLECFYSLKRFAGVDCTQLGCALDHVSRRSRNQLMYPVEVDVYESRTNQTYRIRGGHRLQLVNLFSTCLCAACKLPLWGYHHQGYRCQDCSQLLHADCKGTVQDCSAASQPLALRHLFPTMINYEDLRQSFMEFYRGLICSWESHPISGAPAISSPAAQSPNQPNQPKHRYSYEEASCNASVLALQLELLKTGIARGEIQVHEWIQEGQRTDESLMVASGFELLTLQKHFVDLEQSLRAPSQSSSLSLFLSDFFEDSQPDSCLLFSTRYWSHFAALAKTMMKEAETAGGAGTGAASQMGYNPQQALSTPIDGQPQQGEEFFAIGADSAQDKLLANHAVQTDHLLPLATIYRFCMRRMGFQSSWTAQLVLQEWIKIGLLERLDGELCLFENATAETAFSPPAVAPSPSSKAFARSEPSSNSNSNNVPALPTFQTSYFDSSFGGGNGSGSRNTACVVTIRNVHCLFPMVTAIDPTSDVENLILAVWRCLSSVDLSVNECGFLLLTRQGWPDPFMSDYTKERLVGCVFHWLLMEDNQLFFIHRNYTSKGRKIPGVRMDLEEQINRKRTKISNVGNQGPGTSGAENTNTFASTTLPATTATTARTAVGTGTSSMIAAAAMMTGSASVYNNTNVGGTNSGSSAGYYSNQFGTVGSFVMTRKLMVKRFVLPWLKQVMDLSPEGYADMAYRQIRVLEREMATEVESRYQTEEEQQKFRYAQVECYLESITKLRHSGFLFGVFSSVLCRWLEEVEGMSEGMDVTSKGFKALNRLFIKASSNNNSGNGSRVNSGLGFGTMQSNGHLAPSGHSTPGSGHRSFAAGADTEWRSRLKAKLYQGSNSSSTGSNSLSSMDVPLTPGESAAVLQQQEDVGENPLTTLRVMLKTVRDKEKGEERSIRKALFWMDLMVQSGVQVPAQAFLECCECLIDVAGVPAMTSTTRKTLDPESSPDQPTEALPSIIGEQVQSPALGCSELLKQSKAYLKTCWEHIVLSTYRISEDEVSVILDTVLSANQAQILKAMGGDDPGDVESVQQVLKYALVIVMYVYGCPLHIVLSLEIAPVSAKVKAPLSQHGKHAHGGIGPLPLLPQPNSRQTRQSLYPMELDRNAVPISMLLKCLRSTSISLQGEVLQGLAIIIEHAQRVSNMVNFVDSIQKEIVSCLWELLSPLNDHMVNTTLPLFVRLVISRPKFLHKIVDRHFNSPDWETRFSALDPVYGLFSKLDDAMVTKLFFQQSVPMISPQGTMLSSKGKGVDKSQRKRDRQQDQQQQHTKTGTSSFEPDKSESSGTGLSYQGRRDTLRSHDNQHQPNPQHQQRSYPIPVSHVQFVPEHLQIFGPVFSHFVSSMWDKEDAVRTKAKTLLKSLQPVHVCHALKAWELHFIDSPPNIQQTLLKLMTRLNNYFPSWKIMDYGVVFNLLTSGGLGRFVTNYSNDVSAGPIDTVNSAAPSIHDGHEPLGEGMVMGSLSEDESQMNRADSKRISSSPKELASKRASIAPLSFFGGAGGVVLSAKEAAVQNQKVLQREHTGSLGNSFMPGAPPLPAFMPTGESSRSQQRASISQSPKPPEHQMESTPAVATDEEKERDKQLALEDDIQCSLLNLALQMVANGIEPKLDEVIQLKYLVVFYLDFEGCELLSLGQGKFQVRYGEYIPRQRVSPIRGGNNEGVNNGDLLNDPGHEAFVLVICKNLQQILDRYIEIKPDHERDPPTLYERSGSKDASQPDVNGGVGGHTYGGHEADAIQGDFQMQPSHGGRTFTVTTTTTTTTTTADLRKEGGRRAASNVQQDDEGDSDQVPSYRDQGLFCFSRQRKRQENSHQQVDDSYYQEEQHHQQHHRRNRRRGLDENVVGSYFVDVILRFFGSETDLSELPAGRLKDWLELLLVLIYKHVKEGRQLSDQLSDLIVVLMKRIVEMLMLKKPNPVTTSVGTNMDAASGTGTSAGVGDTVNGHVMAVTGAAGSGANAGSFAGEESISDENTLLAISICSTLLKHSPTLTTTLLSREIMAMGRLMTRRRDDPDDPVFVRAKNFLHDTFVHFMGSGLFVLVFKTQPIRNMSSISWEDDEIDHDLDLFYVLATVLGEEEMIPLDPTSTSTWATNTRLVLFRDQPIRDILDRVTIFRDLEPVQVSTILINLALYVQRVHSMFKDPNLIPDMGQLLIKITKYTADWDHQQQQKHKEQAQHSKIAQERQQYQQQHHHLLQQHLMMRPQVAAHRASDPLIFGMTSTMTSNISAPQPKQPKKQVLKQKPQQEQSSTQDNGISEQLPSRPQSVSEIEEVVSQRRNTVTSIPLSLSTPTDSFLPSSPSLEPESMQQKQQVTQQPAVPSYVTSESHQPPLERPKSPTSNNRTSFDLENSGVLGRLKKTRHDSIFSGSQASSSIHHRQEQQKSPPTQRRPTGDVQQQEQQQQHWSYSSAVLGMCSSLMIQNPQEGHHLIPAVKQVLKQALYRDKLSANALIRLVIAYCYMAESDFALPLGNIFGEFLVEELKSSMRQSHAPNGQGNGTSASPGTGKYDDSSDDDIAVLRKDKEGEEDERERHLAQTMRNSKVYEKEKDNAINGTKGTTASGGQGTGTANFGNGRTKILPCNFHLLHHLFLWDIDPSYNKEWTHIKCEILGSMRFPHGQPSLFPGANDALRRKTMAIVSDWVDRYSR